MVKKILSALIASTFAITSIATPSYAAKAFVLSDEQLDNVHAGGLNVSFFEFFRTSTNFRSPANNVNPKQAANNSGNNLNTSNSSSNNLIQTSQNPNVQILSVGPTNQTPQGANTNSSTNTSTNPNDLSPNFGNDAANQLSSPSPNVPLPESTNNSSGNTSISNFNTTPLLSAGAGLSNNEGAGDQLNSSLANSPASTATPANTSAGQNFPSAGEISNNNGIPDVASSLLPNNPEPTNLAANNVASNNPTSNNINTEPQTVDQNAITPTNNNTPTGNNTASLQPSIQQLDVFAQQNPNGQLDVAIGIPVDPTNDLPIPTTPELPSGNLNIFPNGGGVNIVNVADDSQRNLSALVNIASAGAPTFVQLNLYYINNSTISNLSNSNQIDFSNFNTFQFK